MIRIHFLIVSLYFSTAHAQMTINNRGSGGSTINREIIDNKKTVKVNKQNVLIFASEFLAANSTQQVFQYICAQFPKPYKITAATIKGKNSSFEQFAQIDLSETLKQIPWQTVVIQGHPEKALNSSENYKNNAKILIQKLQRLNLDVILVMPPAPDRSSEQTRQLLKVHQQISEENKCRLAPIGSAFYIAKKHAKELKLFLADNKTPTPQGSYLSAAVLAHSLTGQNSIGQKQLGLRSISKAEGLYLQKALTKTMQDYAKYLKNKKN